MGPYRLNGKIIELNMAKLGPTKFQVVVKPILTKINWEEDPKGYYEYLYKRLVDEHCQIYSGSHVAAVISTDTTKHEDHCMVLQDVEPHKI